MVATSKDCMNFQKKFSLSEVCKYTKLYINIIQATV